MEDMKMCKKILALVLAALFVAAMLCGCAGSGTQTNTEPSDTQSTEETPAAPAADTQTDAAVEKLTLIVQASDDVRIGILNDYILPNFEAAFPGYELEVTTITGEDDSIALMKTYHATGDMADVYWSDARWALPMISAGSQLNLADYIAADGFADNWSSTSLMNFSGGIYALQPGSDASYFPAVYYNTEIFDQYGLEVPTTLEELYAVCDKLVAEGVVPFAMDDTWIIGNILFQAILQANDPTVVEKLLANEIDYTDPAVLAAYEQLDDMFERGYFGDRGTVAARDISETKELFAAGKTAMIYDMYWNYTMYDNGHTDVFPWPSSNDAYPTGTVTQIWGSTVAGYAVNANSSHLDAAVKLAEYCCEQEARYHNEHGTATVFQTGIEIQAQSELQQAMVNLFNAATTKIATIPQNTMDAATASEWETLTSSFAAGQLTPAQMVEQWSDVYAQNTYFD